MNESRTMNILQDIKMITVHCIKERLLLRQYYYGKEYCHCPLYVSLVDNRRNSFGLTDRLKGIVSLYAFSKVKQVQYKCNFVHPFLLSSFLAENQYQWKVREHEVSSNPKQVRIMILQGEAGKRLLQYNSPKQLHAYMNRDYLPLINKTYHENFDWGTLFNELFKPTPLLQDQLTLNLQRTGASYIGCVFRFQSLLGDFKEYDFPTLNSDAQYALIEQCLRELLVIKTQYGKPILVTSDSSKFLQIAAKQKGVMAMEGRVVHLDCTSDEDTAVYMKSFVDFFMLAQAERIFSIGTSKMYPTEFPLYAAKINNIPFERILI